MGIAAIRAFTPVFDGLMAAQSILGDNRSEILGQWPPTPLRRGPEPIKL
jgi:hypothetical protein